MSNSERKANLVQVVKTTELDFKKLALIHGAVDFDREMSYSLQILQNNSYLHQVAMGDPDSLKRAILNVAAIGLTLSPVEKLAYLVPRGKKVCLDISYLGYIRLAEQSGNIKYVHAEIVRENDTFQLNGFGKEPTHMFKPFDRVEDRGPIVGAYCMAKTSKNDFLVTNMVIEDIYSIRDRSESFKAGKGGPWTTDESEMIKKTVIKRAWKSWPKAVEDTRLARAIDVTNDVDFSAPPAQSQIPGKVESDELTKIRALLSELNRTEEMYISHLTRANKREIKKLEDLTPVEVTQAIAMLEGWLRVEKKKKETANENVG